MKPETATRLLNLNKQFYQTFGKEFSSTRMRLQPGVKRILEKLTRTESILDLGCGNGELARELSRCNFSGEYLGLDSSRSLLSNTEGLPSRFSFIEADFTLPDWDQKLNADHWTLITAFAALHHIPSRDLRLNLLHKVHTLLSSGGQFVHAEWQFLNSDKLRARVQPWDEIGLTEADVDANDYLLDWRSGGRGLRYVHHFNEAELDALAAASRFQIRDTFYSDGENGKLGLYQVWEKME